MGDVVWTTDSISSGWSPYHVLSFASTTTTTTTAYPLEAFNDKKGNMQ